MKCQHIRRSWKLEGPVFESTICDPPSSMEWAGTSFLLGEEGSDSSGEPLRFLQAIEGMYFLVYPTPQLEGNQEENLNTPVNR